jgi:alpha-tubulin suppressor-like RCC1 family protein
MLGSGMVCTPAPPCFPQGAARRVVFAWGEGGYGQLGLGDTQPQCWPQRVTALDKYAGPASAAAR